MTNEMADRHQRRMGMQRWSSYRCDMDYLPDSRYGRAEERVRGASMGALLGRRLRPRACSSERGTPGGRLLPGGRRLEAAGRSK